MSLIVRLLVNAAALWAAVQLVPGLSYAGPWYGLLVVALVFGLINTLVRPIVKFFTLPFLFVTLGLFIFVINALMLWLTSWIAQGFGYSFRVSGFVAAFTGALVVSFVSFVLSWFVKEEKDKKDR